MNNSSSASLSQHEVCSCRTNLAFASVVECARRIPAWRYMCFCPVTPRPVLQDIGFTGWQHRSMKGRRWAIKLCSENCPPFGTSAKKTGDVSTKARNDLIRISWRRDSTGEPSFLSLCSDVSQELTWLCFLCATLSQARVFGIRFNL